MFKLITFRSDGAFWPLAQRSDVQGTPQPGSAIGGILTAPWRIARAMAAELAARRAMQTLDDLDERMLRDVGIDRCQIRHAARYGREALTEGHTVRWS